MKKDLGIALVSGGMDSVVAAAIALRKMPLAFLHVTYGQRTAAREQRSFHASADFYEIEQRKVVSLDFLREFGGSSLLDESLSVPDVSELKSDSVPTTYVPFRNTLLLSVAVAWAETLDAKTIVIGAVEEDSAGYPDCRREYFEAFNRLTQIGIRPESEITILTPVIDMSKSEIVRRGTELGAPFELTWSCYRETDKACGRCDSCVRRLRAFKEAGIPDPIEYES